MQSGKYLRLRNRGGESFHQLSVFLDGQEQCLGLVTMPTWHNPTGMAVNCSWKTQAIV